MRRKLEENKIDVTIFEIYFQLSDLARHVCQAFGDPPFIKSHEPKKERDPAY